MVKYANDIEDLLEQLSDQNNCNVLDYIDDTVEAIKGLQARAETAEAIVDKYQTEIVPRLRERAETAEKENAQLKEDLGNWSYNCKAAVERAQHFKRERDAAVEQLHGNCSACKNFEKNEEAGYFDFVCNHAGVCSWSYGETDNDKWEWNGGDKED